MIESIFKKAQTDFDFYETNGKHANLIYENCRSSTKLKVIDICSGLESLIKPWYDNDHDITLIELNEDFIPILKLRFPKAKIITVDYLTYVDNEQYDVYLCNPPFNDDNETIYPYFSAKYYSH